jgi:hypothetical protein
MLARPCFLAMVFLVIQLILISIISQQVLAGSSHGGASEGCKCQGTIDCYYVFFSLNVFVLDCGFDLLEHLQ